MPGASYIEAYLLCNTFWQISRINFLTDLFYLHQNIHGSPNSIAFHNLYGTIVLFLPTCLV